MRRPMRPHPTALGATLREGSLTAAAETVRALDAETRQLLGEDYDVLMRILDVLESLGDEPATG